jgi:hypothetical protein
VEEEISVDSLLRGFPSRVTKYMDKNIPERTG